LTGLQTFYSRFLNEDNVADPSLYILWGLHSLVVLPVDGRKVPIIQKQDLIQKDSYITTASSKFNKP
jgi:hypothetical protein